MQKQLSCIKRVHPFKYLGENQSYVDAAISWPPPLILQLRLFEGRMHTFYTAWLFSMDSVFFYNVY